MMDLINKELSLAQGRERRERRRKRLDTGALGIFIVRFIALRDGLS